MGSSAACRARGPSRSWAAHRVVPRRSRCAPSPRHRRLVPSRHGWTCLDDFDPLEAAERGVDLRWLVVVRPTRPVDGLRIVGAMLASRSIDLLVLDLPSRMPTDQAGLLRQLAAQARRVGGRVLAIGSGSLTPGVRDALAESSHLRLALTHRDWLRVGREVVGQRVTVTVEKDRAGAPGRATENRDPVPAGRGARSRHRPAPGCGRGGHRGDRQGDRPTGAACDTAASRPSPPYRARSSTDP